MNSDFTNDGLFGFLLNILLKTHFKKTYFLQLTGYGVASISRG